jgi:hypothetical protein
MADEKIPGTEAGDSRITTASVAVANSVLPDEHKAHQQKLAQSGYGIPDGFYATHPDLPTADESAEEQAGDGGSKAGDVDQTKSAHGADMPPALTGAELGERQRKAANTRIPAADPNIAPTAAALAAGGSQRVNANANPSTTDTAGSNTRDGITFASDAAEKEYVSKGLTPSDLQNRTPSSQRGYTKDDVEAAAKEKEGGTQ